MGHSPRKLPSQGLRLTRTYAKLDVVGAAGAPTLIEG